MWSHPCLSPKKELVTHSETMAIVAIEREAELQLFYHRIHQYKPTTVAFLSTLVLIMEFFLKMKKRNCYSIHCYYRR